MSEHLDELLSSGRPYCLLARRSPMSRRVEQVTTLVGAIREHTFVRELPKKLSQAIDCVSIVPFSQIRERGFEAIHDDERIISLHVENATTESLEAFLVRQAPRLPFVEIEGHNMTVQDFEERVAAIVEDVIGGGEGSSFLFSRKTFLNIKDYSPEIAVSIFRRLIDTEIGFYLGFLFFDGHRYFIGASPERHLSIIRGRATMNPICGTLPKAQIQTEEDFVRFLRNPKEIDELFQVVDETLKIMARMCQRGGNIDGPKIKEMGTLFHTEYDLTGICGMNCLDAFVSSMYAPTMVGSPLESAARVIAKYERDSRRYYSSAIVIQGRDETGDFLDSAITIRTLEVDAAGRGIVQAGASVVKDSIPRLESKEIEAKAHAIIGVFSNKSKPPIQVNLNLRSMQGVLRERNERVSTFWLRKTDDVPTGSFKVLTIDNEDNFTHMLGHIFSRLGGLVDIVRPAEVADTYRDYDLTVLGPGPGDPQDDGDPRMRENLALVDRLFKNNSSFFGVCLGHQIIARYLGFPIRRVSPPPQGTQITAQVCGKSERLGMYNSFFAFDSLSNAVDGVIVDKDLEGKIYSIRGKTFATFQFHPESILTENGFDIVRSELRRLRILS